MTDWRVSTYPAERTRPGKGVRGALALAFAPLLLLAGCGHGSADLNGTTWMVTSVDGVELGGLRPMISFELHNPGPFYAAADIYSGCAVIHTNVAVPGEFMDSVELPANEVHYWDLIFGTARTATGCYFLSAEKEELNLAAFRNVTGWRSLDSDHIELKGAHIARLTRVSW